MLRVLGPATFYRKEASVWQPSGAKKGKFMGGWPLKTRLRSPTVFPHKLQRLTLDLFISMHLISVVKFPVPALCFILSVTTDSMCSSAVGARCVDAFFSLSP